MHGSDERRLYEREYTDSEGFIVIEKCRPIPCRLEDRSENGVRLKVHSVFGLPEAFTVELPATGEVLSVRTMWRKPGELGAQFEMRKAA